MHSYVSPHRLARAALVLALTSVVGAAALHAADKPSLAALTYSDEQTALDAIDTEFNAAGNDAAKLAAVEKTLFALLGRSETTFAARQAACTRLGMLLALTAPKAAADGYKPLQTLLADDRDSDLARLALEPAPGAIVDGFFSTALGKTTGRTRLGLLDSIARRRATGNVAAVAALIKDADPATATAAPRTLGEIGGAEALAALRTAPEQKAPAVIAAKLKIAARLPAAEAAPLAREIEKDAADPAQKAAAQRLSLALDPAGALARIVEALSGQDWLPKQAALEAAQNAAPAAFVAAVAPKLKSFDLPTQAAVVAALGRKADASAAPLLVAAVAHENVDVRRAAIEAIGFLPGTRDLALALARAALAPGADDAKPAKQSLARLNGPGVSAAVVEGAERGEPASRAFYIEQLALRGMADSLPLLLKLRGDADASVRATAVAAVGDLGSAKEIPVLIDWMSAATDTNEQSRALAALVKVTLRQPDSPKRGSELLSALEKASPDVALRLLPATTRIGNKASAEAAARLALRNDEKVAEAAVAALGRWTDRTPLLPLAEVAEKAAVASVRPTATQTVLRLMERNRDPWTPELTTVLSRLSGASKDADARKRIVGLLNRANDNAALKLAESLRSDTALAATAAETVETIQANLAGTPIVRGSPSASVGNIVDGKTATRWTVPAAGEEWLEVDFRKARPLHKLILDQTARTAEFPERYEVYVTNDPAIPGKVVASGTGQRNQTTISLPAGTRGRYVIIRNTLERKDTPWSVCELYVE